MNTRITWLFGVAALVAVTFVVADDKKKDALEGIKCPVSGKAVKADKTADYKGGHVYFCCENCAAAFGKDDSKFITKANAQLVATHQAKQEKCPLSGGKLNPETKIQVAGIDVCFCCDKCQGAVSKAEGDDQLEKVFGEKAFAKAFKVVKAEKKSE